MIPIRLFEPFLKPPSSLLSIPKLGMLSAAELVCSVAAVGIGMRLFGGLFGFVGWIGGALLGALLMLIVMRYQFDGQPFLRIASALVQFWWLKRMQPSALTIDLTSRCAVGQVGRGPTLVTDQDGRVAQIEWQGGGNES